MKLGTWIVTGIAVVLVVPLVVVLVVVASQAGSHEGSSTAATISPGPGDSPDFVYSSADSVAAYRLALEQGHLLAQMPCFCGCVNLPQDAHQSLLDCFANEDGSLDSHASACTICQDIALDAVRWQHEGLSVAEIRSRVEEKYGVYAPATGTPPVSE